MEKKKQSRLDLLKKETTKKPKDEYNIIVAKDGTGDYTSIQAAINNSPSFPYKKVTVTIKNGVYNEKIQILENNPNLHIVGESTAKTILTYNDNFSKINLGRNSTFYTATVEIQADDCSISNLTIENTSGNTGQAIALSLKGNRIRIADSKLIGNQDTLYLSGENHKIYVANCYIDGTTDFIFGNATAFFENCTIHSKSDSYITAASTTPNSAFGFVFENCKITADAGINQVYLGRPWRIYAKTAFINCEIGNHILPEGWHNWDKKDAEENSFYAEYNNTGEGFKPENRVQWSHQLSKKQVKKFTKENILTDRTIIKNQNWFTN